jgi:hypothetical protein
MKATNACLIAALTSIFSIVLLAQQNKGEKPDPTMPVAARALASKPAIGSSFANPLELFPAFRKDVLSRDPMEGVKEFLSDQALKLAEGAPETNAQWIVEITQRQKDGILSQDSITVREGKMTTIEVQGDRRFTFLISQTDKPNRPFCMFRRDYVCVGKGFWEGPMEMGTIRGSVYSGPRGYYDLWDRGGSEPSFEISAKRLASNSEVENRAK